MAIYVVRTEGAQTTIEADGRDEARELAEQWLAEGDWDTSAGTVYVDGWMVEVDDDGDELDLGDRLTVSIDQPEPPCAPGWDHDWCSPHWLVGGIESNPGVWGKGGGVTIDEACLRCGCRRRTDTWAQRRDTGEQGLQEITYQAGHYDLPNWDAVISDDEVGWAEAAGACEAALDWLREAPRTVADLYEKCPEWYHWAAERLLTAVGRAA